MYPAVRNYAHTGYLLIIGSAAAQFVFKMSIDHPDDGIDLRNDRTEQLHIPCFESLAHKGVVGIAEGAPCCIECCLKIHALRHKKTDELGYADGGVGII